MLARQSILRTSSARAPAVTASAQVSSRNMATLRELELRLKSVRNIEKITKSMKMIATTRLNKATRAMQAGKQYGDANNEVFQHSLGAADSSAESTSTASKRKLFLVVSSDKGLCGGIHSSVSKATRRTLAGAKEGIQSVGPTESDSPIMIIGDKARAQLSRALPDQLVMTFNQIGRDVPTFADAAEVADLILKTDVKHDSVVIIHNKFVSAISYEATAVEVPTEALFKDSAGFAAYELEEDNLTKDLAEFSLANAIFSALTESYACEISARRNAMDNASKSAKDMIGALQTQYNRGRQAAITNELIDIITGASAL